MKFPVSFVFLSTTLFLVGIHAIPADVMSMSKNDGEHQTPDKTINSNLCCGLFRSKRHDLPQINSLSSDGDIVHVPNVPENMFIDPISATKQVGSDGDYVHIPDLVPKNHQKPPLDPTGIYRNIQ